MTDTIFALEGAQAARPGRFSAFDSPLGYRRQPTPVFEPGLADLRTENMRGPSYAAMLHPYDTRGVVVMAYRDTYTKRDGTRGTGPPTAARRGTSSAGPWTSWSRSPSR
ncbi:hypothetical protein MSPGM_16130 [Methylorubrum sp. GM97]|nr:hypothetical protein MSPGM_16130 [Methylorubrum sp. GM97]